MYFGVQIPSPALKLFTLISYLKKKEKAKLSLSFFSFYRQGQIFFIGSRLKGELSGDFSELILRPTPSTKSVILANLDFLSWVEQREESMKQLFF
jgi:hypothetical protein